MAARAPKRLWTLGADARGMSSDARRYQSTKAAVRGWVHQSYDREPVVLMSSTGPIDFTDQFRALHWPHREILVHAPGSDETIAADPNQQANYEHHIAVCLVDPVEMDKIIHKKRPGHTCAWIEHTTAMHKAYLRDTTANAALIENLLTSKGIT